MSDTAAIVHKSYFEGTVQSLGFHSAVGRASVGVVLPGEYDFGIIQTNEIIFVTSGALQINGQRYRSGETCTVLAGQQVFIVATEISSYLCLYGA